MEEEFKKQDEDDDIGKRSDANVEAEGMEGVGDVLDGGTGILTSRIEKGEVLGAGAEEIVMENIPAWDTERGVAEDLEILQDVQDVCMEESSKEAGICDGLAGTVGVAEEDGGRLVDTSTMKNVTSEKKKVVLDWKQAVVNGRGLNTDGEDTNVAGGADRRQDEEIAETVGAQKGLQEGHHKQGKGSAGRPMKMCREIVFNEEGGGFIANDGVTVHVDQEEVLECEKSLEHALVGRILGRPIPFGFLYKN